MHICMTKKAEWIRSLRKQAGLNQSQFADLLGVTQPTVSRWEKGAVPDPDQWDRLLEEERKIRQGDGFDDPNIPIVGYVGGGQEVWPFDDHPQGGSLEHGGIKLPFKTGPGAVAVVVRGPSMRPAYREGDVLVYDHQLAGDDLNHLIGSECVVRLSDGRAFVKVLTPGSGKGLWTLTSHNADPMLDQVVEWAARVKWVEKR